MRQFIDIVEGAGITGRFYHGAKVAFDAFDPARAADGHAQEGCGFYFTSDRDDAIHYAGSTGYLLTVELRIDRQLPLTGRARRQDVEALMRASPELDSTLENWDENPSRAFAAALNGMMSRGTPKEVFEQVWWDFYRSHPAEFLAEVSRLGYDGTVFPRSALRDGTPVQHVVMYNVEKIKIVGREKLG